MDYIVDGNTVDYELKRELRAIRIHTYRMTHPKQHQTNQFNVQKIKIGICLTRTLSIPGLGRRL